MHGPRCLGSLLALGVMMGAAAADGYPGMPPVTDPTNLYSETAAGKMSPATQGALARIYVPEHGGNSGQAGPGSHHDHPIRSHAPPRADGEGRGAGGPR